ncbi:MAG: hypothetical protein QNJ33_05475 [Crocosphaera sp.]|nr:hypothetical protein [Crocosphaera sp.]
MNKINFSISEIIEIYNTIPRVLDNKVTKVNLESYYAYSKEKLLIEVTNGSYWIIETEDGKEWLLPSDKLTVNQFNQKSLQSFFEFQSYDDSENKVFILVQPATVNLLPNASKKEWKLETLGILNFDPNYSTNKLRSQLKQTENERDQYKSDLEEIKQEKEQLTAQVAQLASDSLQDIRDSLVTKNELNQQINIVLQRIDRLEKQYKGYPSADELSQVIQNIIKTVNENNEVIQDNVSRINEKLTIFEEERSQIQEQLNQVPELLNSIRNQTK